MGQLDRISSPDDVRRLTSRQADDLAAEIRTFLVDQVSRTGGHLGPNLGVVELTIAMHRVFESPLDTMVFDTGHQAYVHKLLTGRRDFSQLRSKGGLSGYPSRAESEHDVVENSHASTALSWADGIAKANELQGRGDRHVVAVIGDGALTGGMAWEALNNIAAGQDRRLVIVVNDNGRSYAPTIGGLAHHLDTLRTTRGYENVLSWGKRTLRRSGLPGRATYDALHGMKKGIKDVLAPQGMFEDLGIKYVGPVDGHDVRAVERALRSAKAFGGPVIVHVITEKGRGYVPAEQDVADRFHAVGKIHPETGLPVAPSRFEWTSVFADELVRIGRRRPDVVAITAAMLQPVGLAPFAAEFPDARVRRRHRRAARGDLGRGHGVRRAAPGRRGLRDLPQPRLRPGPHGRRPAQGGRHVRARPRRAHRLRRCQPQRHVGHGDARASSPGCGSRRRATRRPCATRCATAVDVDDAPTVIRYPKGALVDPVPAIDHLDGVDVLARHEGPADAPHVLVVGYGAMAQTGARDRRGARRARPARHRRRPALGHARRRRR